MTNNCFYICFCSITEKKLPPVLAGEVDKLPEILHKSRAANTSKKYELSFIRYTKWAMCNGVTSGDILPAKPLLVSLYLHSLIQTANTPSSVITASYALKWIHDMYGFNSPTESKLVVNVLESVKSSL